MQTNDLYVINPLRTALAHYEQALVANASAAGFSVRVHSFDEPSASGEARWRWVARYVGALLRHRRRSGDRANDLIVLWPVLGYLDVVLTSVLCGGLRARLVLHDPLPLVRRAVGYSRAARLLAGLFGRRHSFIVHSDDARRAVEKLAPRVPITQLPLPLSVVDERAAGARRSGRRVVRVLGQFKKERDLRLLHDLASVLDDTWRLEIIGRGWPEVLGWHRVDEFVAEDAFEGLLAGATVVLIPYRRLFQSEVALRSLEVGTPFVGPDISFLRALYGDEAAGRLLVDASRGGRDIERWKEAVLAAAGVDRAQVRRWAEQARERSVAAWAALPAEAR